MSIWAWLKRIKFYARLKLVKTHQKTHNFYASALIGCRMFEHAVFGPGEALRSSTPPQPPLELADVTANESPVVDAETCSQVNFGTQM